MKLPKKLPWYFFTRAIGAIAALYELVLDRSPERGTIIIAAFGLMGFDWVARREEQYESKSEKREVKDDERENRDSKESTKDDTSKPE